MIAREYPFTAAESKDIAAALRTYHSKFSSRSSKGWYQHVDVSRVLTSILEGDTLSALVDGYLVMYEIGSPWYNPDLTMLEEVMVIQVYPGGSFGSVTSFFESKAKAFGCKLIAVGTALAKNDRALCKMYEAAGYKVAAVQLTKTV